MAAEFVDAERAQKILRAHAPALVDALQQGVGRFGADALQARELFAGQGIKIARIADQSAIIKLFEQLRPKPLDLHIGGKMLELAHPLSAAARKMVGA